MKGNSVRRDIMLYSSHSDRSQSQQDCLEPHAAKQGQPLRRGMWQSLRAGQWEVYYDGNCSFCRRWVRSGQRWCHPLIQWRDFRVHGGDVAHLHPNFNQAAYLIIDRERALPGFLACRKLVLVSPRLWPLLLLVYFPGSGWLGPVVYRWIANHYGPAGPKVPCSLR